jgi:hypothetical protein
MTRYSSQSWMTRSSVAGCYPTSRNLMAHQSHNRCNLRLMNSLVVPGPIQGPEKKKSSPKWGAAPTGPTRRCRLRGGDSNRQAVLTPRRCPLSPQTFCYQLLPRSVKQPQLLSDQRKRGSSKSSGVLISQPSHHLVHHRARHLLCDFEQPYPN